MRTISASQKTVKGKVLLVMLVIAIIILCFAVCTHILPPQPVDLPDMIVPETGSNIRY